MSRKVPPHALAVRVLELDAVHDRVRLDRELRDGFTMPRSSAAVVVTILKVEPGGCGAEKAMPARARISPLRGSSAATPPSRPASADHGGLLEAGVDGRLHRLGGARLARARARGSPAISSPPGRPRRRCSNASSSPLCPTGQSARESARVEAPSAPRGSPGPPSGPRSSPRCPRAARSAPAPGLAEHLAVAERIVARFGGRLARLSRSPRRSSGTHEPRRPCHVLARHRDLDLAAQGAEHARADNHRHGTESSSTPAGSSTSIELAVAVAAARS